MYYRISIDSITIITVIDIITIITVITTRSIKDMLLTFVLLAAILNLTNIDFEENDDSHSGGVKIVNEDTHFAYGL